ncbi:hypothetical protein ACWC2K_02840 [Streptomyces chattanoogensis]
MSAGVWSRLRWWVEEAWNRHVGYRERCADTASADEAQGWCLKHAGLTGDRCFAMKGSQFFTAYLTNAAADGTPPTT